MCLYYYLLQRSRNDAELWLTDKEVGQNVYRYGTISPPTWHLSLLWVKFLCFILFRHELENLATYCLLSEIKWMFDSTGECTETAFYHWKLPIQKVPWKYSHLFSEGSGLGIYLLTFNPFHFILYSSYLNDRFMSLTWYKLNPSYIKTQ